MIEELLKCKYLNQCSLFVYTERDGVDTLKQFFSSKKTELTVSLVVLGDSNYTDRVKHAHKSTAEFSCKMDDDILMSHHVWDFLFESLDKITSKHPIISPIFTNGIPSADTFVQDFIERQEDVQTAHNWFLTERIADTEWGLNYIPINEKLSSMKVWSDREYWEAVTDINTEWDTRPLPWYYFMVRGVHPARYSRHYNMFIANQIINNKDKFFRKNNYWLDTITAPYFCNNLFVAKTEYWKNSTNLFTDGWDEGQLTLQMKLDNATPLYIRNGFAIHMAYGMTRNQQEIETYYMQHLT